MGKLYFSSSCLTIAKMPTESSMSPWPMSPYLGSRHHFHRISCRNRAFIPKPWTLRERERERESERERERVRESETPDRLRAAHDTEEEREGDDGEKGRVRLLVPAERWV